MSIELDNKSLLVKFAHGLGLNVLLRLKGVIFVPILVNYLDKSDIGTIALIQSLSGLFLGLVILNLPDSANKYVLRSDETTQSTIIRYIITFCLVSAIVSAIAIFFFNRIANYKPDVIALFLCLMLVAKVINKLGVFSFQIFQKTALLVKNSVFVEYGALIAVVIMAFTGSLNGFQEVLWVQIGFTLIGSVYLLFKCLDQFPSPRRKLSFDKGPLFKTGLFLLPSLYCFWLIQNSDFIIAEYYLGSEALGEYSFAYSLGNLVTGLSAAVTFFWYSTAVKADEQRLRNIFSKVSFYFLIISMMCMAFFLFATLPIIDLINSDYRVAYRLVNILIGGFLLNILIQVLSGLYYANHQEQNILVAWILGAVLNVILNVLFIPKLGLSWAAFSTLISFFVVAIVLLFRSINIHRGVYGTKSKVLLVSGVALCLAYGFFSYFELYNKWI
ncbi:MAG: oligosaccharide flippase family protein [Cytophagia bacterium]|nr:oligosaccharide flippase family protein [Cytophagia bacterium]